jgi:tricorn protease
VRRILLASLSVLFISILTVAADSGPLLLQSPTLSKTQIAFAYGGDIWIANRSGGDAVRLVTGSGVLSRPILRWE